jgi:hypothetical protein
MIEETALQPGAGECGLFAVDGERLAQSTGAGVATRPAEERLHRAQVEQPELFGPLDDLVQAGGIQSGSEVE